MMILLHIVTALASMILATLSFMKPSVGRLSASYALVAGTLVTGTYLVLSTHVAMLQTCATGLAYLVMVSAALLGAKAKLAKQRL
ncbi:hypothetical protein HJC99_05735 [Candidatus Saccharibacteria bacterium]|nr:hypothetical protein [Candidatus Saccharibacteria bacterium]